ncbi:MarR family winged helix-turn-helix transcriptional regulator [Streptomyces sp. GC420]|uniref:MarR family winged helix-turn-helix transcriptional regulator n=1 Tax=Streptomyces sp. GC420 TaxID=2697568 RepID=UPI001414ECD8|nr:MarR family winged helix-turn-helix transcriptional regulator [Streptomyces sp. GC420]NBM21051.1 winged helix DNA-binding protein [Streptomyces sp. GC420]
MSTASTAPAAPPVNGQVVGLAHYASRAVLERVLARSGITFQQSLALNGVANAAGSVAADELTGALAHALKTDASEVRGSVDGLVAAGLLETLPGEPVRVRFTEAGDALRREIGTAGAEIAARLYADIPAEDLAAAGRVLRLVTERANAELAARN